MKELNRRISVAIWGIPLLVFLTYMGGFYFLLLIMVINGLASWEFYSMFKTKGIYPYRIPALIFGSVFLLLTFFFPQYWETLVVFFIVLMLILHITPQEGMPSQNSVFTISGFSYITLFLSSLLSLSIYFPEWMPFTSRELAHAGGRFIITMFGSIWICDTAAYSAGRKIGKHKLASRVSPNKTIEGAAFGLIFGILGFVVIGKIFLPRLPIVYSILAGSIVGVFGQMGDLVESRFKRNAGVKDTSALLPGHGGIFDRFDSIIFVSPFLWALIRYGNDIGLPG